MPAASAATPTSEDIMKHLIERQIVEMTALLAERNRALAAQVREELAASDNQHYRDIAGAVTDTADEALASEIVNLDAELAHRHIIELRDIEAARERLRNRTYGICSDCGELIPYQRLVAYPTAKRCVKCQQHREKAKGIRQPSL
jgi:DnaK suppressor protein